MFHSEDAELPSEKFLNSITPWLLIVAEKEKQSIEHLNYIFCSDDYLHEINVKYLSHDFLTDVITFDNSEDEGDIEGDIFISIDRVQENAVDVNTSLERELSRVVLHGLLHLLGYNDKSDSEKISMRKKEDSYLSLLK